MTMREKMRSLNRESSNGYEVTFMMHYLSTTHYVWELARYPLDVNRIDEPTEILITFEGRFNWENALEAAKKYLADHPDDGFQD